MSLAVAKAAANELGMPLYRYVGGVSANTLPVPMMNIINGGSHSDAPIAFQEFMIMPVKAKDFTHAMQMGTEIFHNLKKVLHDRNLSTAVGDEGGFAPNLAGGTEDALDSIKLAVENAGYSFGQDVMIALDCAASEFYVEGKKLHTQYTAGLPAGTAPNIVKIENETLVAIYNATTVLTLLYNYYQQRYSQKVKLFATSMAIGDSVYMDTQSGKHLAGIVERMEIDLANGFVSTCEVVGVVL